MKKLFSTLGMMALVSLCLFTSCKDEDVTATPQTPVVVIPTVNNTDLQLAETQAEATASAQALADAQAIDANATQNGNVITYTGTDGSTNEVTVETSYTYTVDGVTYNSMEEVLAALRKKPAGSTATVVATLVQTTTTIKKDANGNPVGQPDVKTETKKGDESKVTIPAAGQTVESVIAHPTSIKTDTKKDVDVTVKSSQSSSHGGGAGTTK
ncbi:MAG: hypothetical protein J6I36_11210 [Bacteroidaceae bacterium]|nr:hypothetical protein [Bacteroidaceae bacterium]MBQ8937664.1 hypothetical protein [Bacteroidaceae bacterium]MBR1791317.1 hypothetical protein [Bacteroidaceae bacterium]